MLYSDQLELDRRPRRPWPSWWRYRSELPMWEVWIGADRQYHATLAVADPPLTVHGADPRALREEIRQAVFRALL